MNTPSTAEYQHHRNNTLRGLAHERVLKTAREMQRTLQKNGYHYTRKQITALRDGIGGTDLWKPSK